MAPISVRKTQVATIGPKQKFTIIPRKPWKLPDDEIRLRTPESAPNEPKAPNFLAMLIPPVLMTAGMLTVALLQPNGSILYVIPMLLMGFGMPFSQWITYKKQHKEYKQALAEREKKYLDYLASARKQAEELVLTQRRILHREYPDIKGLQKIVFTKKNKRRLWWRRLEDHDFLTVRIGIGTGKASFTVQAPEGLDTPDPLLQQAILLSQEFQEVSNLPILIDLKRIGSLAIKSSTPSVAYRLGYRIALDILVHHAPQDAEIVVLAPSKQGKHQYWEWLKWAPHTYALENNPGRLHIAFTGDDVDHTLEWVMSTYHYRLTYKTENDLFTAIILFVDHSSDLRQSRDIKLLSKQGHTVGIYTIFVGGADYPRECRALLETKGNLFKYEETWLIDKEPQIIAGVPELVSSKTCEKISRALAGLEPSGSDASASLPKKVSLFDVLEIEKPSKKQLLSNWQTLKSSPKQLLTFPFGLKSTNKGHLPIVLDLRPEDLDGIGAYHTILVGTTGSGKSEFMKSLVLAAAYRYSPYQVNFFFMDFKGGAAFNDFKQLPHTVGVVTNLSPALVNRGLDAIDFEFKRRQVLLEQSNARDIWQYTKDHPKGMPHIVLFLDEFARGMEDFDRLPDLLNQLVRIGRSLGMYLFLANQDVNAAVTKLLNNVGWRIALRVAQQDEMSIIDRRLPNPDGKGQGYLFSTLQPDGSIPVKFQAAYAGFSLQNKQDLSQNGFKIYRVQPNGLWDLFVEHKETPDNEEHAILTEQQFLLNLSQSILAEHSHLRARPIYLDPLPKTILLHDLFSDDPPQQMFNPDTATWDKKSAIFNINRTLPVTIGEIDQPEKRQQNILSIDFMDKDGHLWVIGATGSGKELVLETLIYSLASTYTPAEAQIYTIVTGMRKKLQALHDLPHVGGIIRTTESERIERLFKYLEKTYQERINTYVAEPNWPHIFLIIDGYRDFAERYELLSSTILQYAQQGKDAHIHLIIASNTRSDIRRLADNLPRRIVLKLPNKDEYIDVLGKRHVPNMALDVPGRGYWVDESVAQFQAACITPPEPQEGQEHHILHEQAPPQEVIRQMKAAWDGPKPKPIQVISECIQLDDVLELCKDLQPYDIVAGIAYETLEPYIFNATTTLNHWAVLGAPKSGKSTALKTLATILAQTKTPETNIYLLQFKKDNSLWDVPPGVSIHTDLAQIPDILNTARTQAKDGQPHFILIDDLPVAYSLKNDDLASAINALADPQADNWPLYVIASGTHTDLQGHYSQSLAKKLRQNKTGLVLGKDEQAMSWLQTTWPRQYTRMLFPRGRGFWVESGQATLLQIPSIAPCNNKR